MKQALVMTAVLALISSLATASGFNLSVSDCASGAASWDVINACSTNTGTIDLVASVRLPVPVTGFVAAASIIEVQFPTLAVPDWWRFDVCRSIAATESADPSVGGSCGTIWDAAPAGTVVSTFINAQYLAPNRERINGVHFVAPDKLYDLSNVTDELAVMKLTISRSKTIGANACTGCTAPATLMLIELNFQPLVGDASLWLRMMNTDVSSWVQYNPPGTATRNRTWGAIKALYH